MSQKNVAARWTAILATLLAPTAMAIDNPPPPSQRRSS